MRKLNIVLVEKDRIMLERLSDVMMKMEQIFLSGRFSELKDAAETTQESPDIVLLDIDVEHIDEIMLLRQCKKIFPLAGIICMSTRWDEKLVSAVVKIGAKGYLVKPFNAEELIKSLAFLEQNGLSKLCTVSAFFSPKGKSGRTTLIANLAMELAAEWGQKVAIIDADVQFGDMAVFFNLKPESTIVEAVRDIKFLTPVTLEQYFTPINERVHVLCGTKTPEVAEYVNPQDLTELIAMTRRSYQHVLIDLPPAFNPISVAATEAADQVFMVSMVNGTYEIENSQRAMEIFKVWEDFEEKVKMIFTRVWPYTDKEKANLEQKLGYPICVIVPNEYSLISESVNKGAMVIEEAPESSFAESVSILASRLCHRKGVR